MKKAALLLLSVFALVMVAYAGDQDFVLVNETGLTIDQFYCSPNNTQDWEEDVLGVETLPNGENIEIKFNRDTKECVWDLLIVDEKGNKIYWQDINLCEAAKITLHYEGGKPTATIEKAETTESSGAQDFVLINETGLSIDQFFCSPNNSQDWEEDVLGVDTLPNGEQIEIKFQRDTKECVWDLMIVDEKGNKIYWQDVNLCETAKITLHYEDGKPTATIEKAQ